jgi:2-dehydro-3-deoxygluconokinase
VKTVTFGEIMLRLSPPAHGRFVQADRFDIVYGGGEANVSVSLANCGLQTEFVTALPDHEIGQAAVNALRRYGVETKHILRQGARIGIYFLENGASQRASKVIYDRAGSSIATARAEDFHWKEILAGADWLHFSGITPAIGEEMAKAVQEACKTAKALGLKVSCDLNYRGKMWTVAQARPVMQDLMQYVDLLIANEQHIADILEIDSSSLPTEDTNLTRAGCIALAEAVHSRYHIPTIAVTQRRSLSASDNRVKGMLWQDGASAFSVQHTMHIVDRVGSGDAFTAGILTGIQKGFGLQKTIDFAAAACCLKHSVEGDFSVMNEQEILALAAGQGSGSVQR